MTVKELIKQLQKYPEDLEVVVTGYEGGYSDVSDLRKLNLKRDYNAGSYYYGPHEEVSENKSDMKVVHIR